MQQVPGTCSTWSCPKTPCSRWTNNCVRTAYTKFKEYTLLVNILWQTVSIHETVCTYFYPMR